MANPFDQFDSEGGSADAPNPFDQFDAPVSTNKYAEADAVLHKRNTSPAPGMPAVESGVKNFAAGVGEDVAGLAGGIIDYGTDPEKRQEAAGLGIFAPLAPVVLPMAKGIGNAVTRAAGYGDAFDASSPGTEKVEKALDQVGLNPGSVEAKTAWDRAARQAGQFAGYAPLGPEAALTAAGSGAVGSLASEAVPERFKPLVNLATAVATGGVAHGITSATVARPEVIAQAVTAAPSVDAAIATAKSVAEAPASVEAATADVRAAGEAAKSAPVWSPVYDDADKQIGWHNPKTDEVVGLTGGPLNSPLQLPAPETAYGEGFTMRPPAPPPPEPLRLPSPETTYGEGFQMRAAPPEPSLVASPAPALGPLEAAANARPENYQGARAVPPPDVKTGSVAPETPISTEIPQEMPLEEPTTENNGFDPLVYLNQARAIVRDKRIPITSDALAKRLDIAPDEASRVIATLVSSPDSGIILDAKGNPRRIAQRSGPPDVASFLADRGGIRDDEGHDLKGSGLQQLVSGAGPLVRSTGMSIDEAGEKLSEAGFFGPAKAGAERPSEADVLDLISQTAGRNKVYLPEDQAGATETASARRDAETQAAAVADIHDVARAYGIEPTQDHVDAVLERMGPRGISAEDATVDYLERLAIQADSEHSTETGNAALDIATPKPAIVVSRQGAADRANGEPVTGSTVEPGATVEGGNIGEATTPRATAIEEAQNVIPPLKPHEGSWIIVDRATGKAVTELFRDNKAIHNLNTEKYKAVPAGEYLASLNEKPEDYIPFQRRREEEPPSMFATEPGAEDARGNALPQTIIPGAERASERTMLERQAQAPLRGEPGQKATTGLGLFDKNAPLEKGGKPEEDQGALFQRRDESPTFFSALTRAVETTKQEKAAPGQWLATIRNTLGVKAEEIAWSGVEDWLNGQTKSVTKAEVLDHLRSNEINVQEVEKGKSALSADEEAERDDLSARYRADPDEVTQAEYERLGELQNRANADAGKGTKFGTYVLPGGENYRELLLTLPSKGPEFDPAKVRVDRSEAKDGITLYYADKKIGRFDDYVGEPRSDDEWVGVARRRFAGDPNLGIKPMDDGATFRSGHFDEPNVLAHVRFDDRTGPNGERVLHVAEVQSDWHQKGRKEGYTDPALIEKAKTARARTDGLRPAVADMLRRNDNLGFDTTGEAQRAIGAESPDAWDFNNDADKQLAHSYFEARQAENANPLKNAHAVPDAPFKTTWQELAMKRMLRYAAENGYDRVSWDTGETQAARYDLSKQIDNIRYTKSADGKSASVEAYRGGENIFNKPNMHLSEVADTFGKDIAEKIERGDASNYDKYSGYKVLSGVDLKVGGEGMKGFYDKIMPAFLNKYAKKWGAKVGETRLTTKDLTVQNKGDAATKAALGVEPVHSIDITPAMRESVMQGQPLFKRGEGKAHPSDTNTQSFGRGTTGGFSPEFHAEREAVATDLQKRLSKIGPKGTALKVPDWIKTGANGKASAVDALYLRKLIAVALDTKDKIGAVNHEVVHALREAGSFNSTEWNILRSKAENEWIAKHGIEERYGNITREQTVEEAIAHEFSDWANAKEKPRTTIGRIFQNMWDTVRSIGDTLRGAKFNTPEDIFGAVDRGTIARRGVAEAGREEPQFQTRDDKPETRAYWNAQTGKVEYRTYTPKPAVETSPEVEKKPRALSLQPIEGEGEWAGRGVNNAAYKVGTEAPQKEAADKMVAKDYDRAVSIALRQEQPPKNVHPEFYYMAVERKATRDGDTATLLKLHNSKIAEEATIMGQRNAAWRNRDELSPVIAMESLEAARTATLKARGVADPVKAKNALTDEYVAGVQATKKAVSRASKRETIQEFIASIRCK